MNRMSPFVWVVSSLLGMSSMVLAGEGPGALAVYPPSLQLDGPRASQRLVVEALDGEVGIADRSASARFQVVDPKVAEVTPDGTVRPLRDGSTTLIVESEGKKVEARVVVSRFNVERLWNFRNHVLPVLTKSGCNQGACHGAAAGKNGFRLSLRGYAPEVDYDVMTRQALGRRIVKTAPAESLLLLKPTGAIEHGGGARFSTDSLEYRVLSEWIAEGLARPSESDPKLVGVEVFPKAVRLAPGSKQTSIVQARYDDGRVEDVTQWTKFTSADDTVAKVDDLGLVVVQGYGEASISAVFAGRVATLIVTSPYRQVVPAARFAEIRLKNRIDEINLVKLKSLNIPPSPDAGDAAFLRRLTLDLTGRLPTIVEARAFLDDKDPAKREKRVDALLATDLYVDYWAYKWSDLFLVSSKKLPVPAMWSFYRFIRQGVAENLGWDEFCRRIITAKGSTLTNGAANYFVLHRDPIDLTESAGMAFLGFAMTCARCHNHPLEKWTQDQYYGMANLFSRIQIKDGPTPGDAIVLASPEGDIPHPRSGAILSPRPLDGAPLAVSDRRDRREAFAAWLVQADNPYFAKAIVNRVWRNFFSRGLIDPEDDLRATNPASDERLLRYLVDDFIAHKYDIKHLIRAITTSGVYARSSEPVTGNEHDVKFLSHYIPERLPAEVLLDALAQVCEVPSPFPGYPSDWRSLQIPDSKADGGFLDTFGRPERLNTCSCERSSEPSMSQALHLVNGSTINDKLRDGRSAVASGLAAGLSDDALIDRLFLAALGRNPTAVEKTKLLAALAEAAKEGPDPKVARRQGIEDLYWATLTGKEFLFNH